MNKISVTKARKEFAELINRTAYRKERYVVTRRNKGVVAIVPMEDLEIIEEIEERIDLEEAKKAWAEQGKKPLKSWDTVKRKLGVK